MPSPGSTTAWQNINHSSENSKVVYIERSLFYAIINYQSKTGELKNIEKLVKQTGQALKVLLELTANVHFCTICEITLLAGGP